MKPLRNADSIESDPTPGPRFSWLTILALACVLTGVNALKPLHIDDTTFYFNAAQIAAHPGDPYGYVMMRFSDPVPALHALAPPGLSYWWACAIRLFGDRPVLWKLWLFPFTLLFVGSLAGLLRRFAPGLATPLLVMLALSPVFLPALNLMMDIPAVALSLTALVLFFRSCDRNTPVLAVLAGLTAGVAMQTKYPAFLAPVIIFVYALLNGKVRLGLSAAVMAGLVFAAWETALFLRYGESHFLYQIWEGENGDQPKRVLIGALSPLLGGAAATLGLLALTVLRLPGRPLLCASLFVLLPYLLVCTDAAELRVFGSGGPALADVSFAILGAAVLLSAGVAWRLVRPSRAESLLCPFSPRGRIAWFLVLWFILEVAGYVAISPFPAVRRIMGITIAATLLVGHLAVQSPLEPGRRNVLRGLAVVTALLGLGFSGVDYLEARAEQQAVEEAARRIRAAQPEAAIWYVGYWGFQFYAEKAGMKQAVPQRNTEDQASYLPPSHFRKGDWLVVPDEGIPQQSLDIDPGGLELMEEIAIADSLPLSTVMCYYAGAPPLRHHSGPRIVVRLYRVTHDLVPR